MKNTIPAPLCAVWRAFASLCLGAVSLHAADQQLTVEVVHGTAQYSLDGSVWQPLYGDTALNVGATLKTSPGSTADLLITYNGSVLRLASDSTLRIQKLSAQPTGADIVTETELSLQQGTLIGAQRKLHKPSWLKIDADRTTATIRGTEYVIKGGGSVSVFKGVVAVSQAGKENDVHPGESFDPITCRVGPTPGPFVQNCGGDLRGVEQCQQDYQEECDYDRDHFRDYDHCRDHFSPTRGHHDHGHDHDHDHDHGPGDHGPGDDHGPGGHGGDGNQHGW